MFRDFDVTITAAHLEAVGAAVRHAFGHDRIDALDPVSGGASGAFPFRVLVRDQQYLIRLEGAASPLRNPHQYDSMRIASEHGIAPRLYYSDEAARVAVMDFVEEQPITTFPGGRHKLVEAVGDLLARVRATPSFPFYVDYPDIVGRLWAWVCQTGLFAPGRLDPYTRRLADVCETYQWHSASTVSGHNDPVPRNILFDGRRLWLIDWESAYRNDPLVDTAITLDNLAPSTELQTSLLEASWSGALNGEFYRRLSQVRVLTRLYYAGVLLSASFAGLGPLGDDDLHGLSMAELRADVLEGRLTPGTPTMAHALGKMYLAAVLRDIVPPPLDHRLLMEDP